MISLPLPGHVVAGRYHVERIISESPIASVYLAVDQASAKRTILKVFVKDGDGTLEQYARRLSDLTKTFSNDCPAELVIPIEVGETSYFYFAVFDFYESAESLDKVLGREQQLLPKNVMAVVKNVAIALDLLHRHNIVHGDIKPSNILVQKGTFDRIHLIDFGLIVPGELKTQATIIGTYNYLHPRLRGGVFKTQKLIKSQVMRVQRIEVGSFLDYYALGVTAVELLTGSPTLPSPLSEEALCDLLTRHSHGVSALSPEERYNLAFVLNQLLTLPEDFTFEDTGLLFTYINTEHDNLPLQSSQPPRAYGVNRTSRLTSQGAAEPLADVINNLSGIRKNLTHQTSPMVGSLSGIELAPTVEGQVAAQVMTVFANAQKRAKQSWVLTIGFSVIAYTFVIAMLVTALVMTVVSGESRWSLLFGGVSVSAVLGTLLWKPFDRIFRATLMTQMIEMVHVQTLAVFHTSTDLERRVEACREGVARLQSFAASQFPGEAQESPKADSQT